MNTEQILSLVRSLLKCVGSILLAHGASKAAGIVNGEDTVGLVMTLTGFIASHLSHSSGSAPPQQSKLLGLLFIVPLLLFTPGCAAPPQRVAFSAVQAPALTADSAMRVWNDYLGLRKSQGSPVSTNAELQVVRAYAKYRAVELASIDTAHAGADLSGSTNFVAGVVATAQTPEAQNALSELVGLIRLFGANP